MATSSITKQFVIKDEEAFIRLLEALEKKSNEKPKPFDYESSSLYIGRKKLKQFRLKE